MTDQTLNNTRLDAGELQAELCRFYGTEQWYRHSFNKRMLYTDGVKFFAENGGGQGAYWFLDKLATEACQALDAKKESFASVIMAVGEDDTAVITVTDGNDKKLAVYPIDFTDMQVGEWRFFMVHDGEHRVLMLPGEY